MMRAVLLLLSLIFSQIVFCQSIQGSFDGIVGSSGCKAIHMDSSIIKSWASSCKIKRGYIDIANPAKGKVNHGTENDAIGKSNISALSLGDGGHAVLSFEGRVYNGKGPDFAVFENSFSDDFLELAFVEVSTDGIQYVRFPSISETSTSSQIGSFDLIDATNLYNLAGKYRTKWGTPFDLEELKDSISINIDSIYFIRVVDVVGSVNSLYSRHDSKGNVINDPYPTDFKINDKYTGGFDIESVALINYDGIPFLSYEEKEELNRAINVWPNPSKDFLNVKGFGEGSKIVVSDMGGHLLIEDELSSDFPIDVSSLPSGIFIMTVKNELDFYRIKFIHE